MRKEIFVSTLACRSLVYLIRSIDRGIEELYLEYSQGNVAEREYYAVYLSWYDKLTTLSDILDSYAESFGLKQGQIHDNCMLRVIKERRKGMKYDVVIHTDIGQQCFCVFGNLDSLYSAVTVLKFNTKVELRALMLFTNFVNETLISFQQAEAELKKVIQNVKKSSR